MTVVARLEAILSANTRDFESAMTRSESSMKKVGRVAGTAGLAIAAGVAVGLEKSVKAAMDAEQAEARLTQAYKNAHVAIGPLRKQIDELKSAGRKLGFTDDDIVASMGSLITATHNQKQAVKDLSVAQDLARFKGIGLTDSTKMLSMAMTGSQRAVKQLGINVSPVTKNYDALKATMGTTLTATDKLRLAHAKLLDKQATGIAITDAVSAHVKGQAKAYADTAAGGMEQFHAQLNNIEIEIGNKLLPIMTTAIKWITTNWPAISKVIKQDYEAYIKPTLKALGDLVVSVVNLIKDHWNTIGPIVTAVTKTIKDQLNIIIGVIKFFTDILRGNWSAAWNDLKGIVRNVFNDIRDLLKTYILILEDIGKSLGHAILTGLSDGITAGWDLVKNAVTSLFHKVVGWVKDALGISSPSSVFHEIGQNAIQGFINGVGSMAGVLKDAVVGMAESAASHLNPFSYGHGGPGGVQGVGTGPRGGHYPAGSNSSFEGFGHLQGQVVEALRYARGHGWHGQVTSGYRSYAQQSALYQAYLHGGPLAAKPGSSSHETGAAVDVTAYGTFGAIMRHAPGFERLYNRLGARDPVHYSISGYDQGGWLPTGVSLAVNNTGRPERVVGPGDGGDHFHFHGPVLDGAKLLEFIRNESARFGRRNGYPAFGGA